MTFGSLDPDFNIPCGMLPSVKRSGPACKDLQRCSFGGQLRASLASNPTSPESCRSYKVASTTMPVSIEEHRDLAASSIEKADAGDASFHHVDEASTETPPTMEAEEKPMNLQAKLAFVVRWHLTPYLMTCSRRTKHGIRLFAGSSMPMS